MVTTCNRDQGHYESKKFMLRSGPGGGKTWALKQWLQSIAKLDGGPEQYVPLLIGARDLAEKLENYGKDPASTHLVRFYIDTAFEGPVFVDTCTSFKRAKDSCQSGRRKEMMRFFNQKIRK